MKSDIHPEELDAMFEAFASEHRREIVFHLGLQPASISQLARLRDLSLPAIHKHIKVLERVGLIIRRKSGRTNFLALDASKIAVVQDWLMQFQTHWGSQSATLENYVASIQKAEDSLIKMEK